MNNKVTSFGKSTYRSSWIFFRCFTLIQRNYDSVTTNEYVAEYVAWLRTKWKQNNDFRVLHLSHLTCHHAISWRATHAPKNPSISTSRGSTFSCSPNSLIDPVVLSSSAMPVGVMSFSPFVLLVSFLCASHGFVPSSRVSLSTSQTQSNSVLSSSGASLLGDELYFVQPIDHFNYITDHLWNQRFFQNGLNR